MRVTFLFAIISLFNFAAAAPIPGKRSPENIFLKLSPHVPKFLPPVISFSFAVPPEQELEITKRVNEDHLISAIREEYEKKKSHWRRAWNWSGPSCTVTEGWHEDDCGAEVIEAECRTKDTRLHRVIVPRKYVAISGGEVCHICSETVYKMTSMCMNTGRNRHDDICLHCYGRWVHTCALLGDPIRCPFCRGPIHDPVWMMSSQTRDCGEGPPSPGCWQCLKDAVTDCWKYHWPQVHPEKKET